MATRAAQTLRTAASDLAAQLIVVYQSDNGSLQKLADLGAEIVTAPVGSSRAQMCDLGMRKAHGSIIVLRDVEAIGDGRWLDAYRHILPHRETTAAESVIMESMVTRKAEFADAGPPLVSRESRARSNGTVEIAAAL